MANYNDIKYPSAVSSNATGLGGSWTLIKTQTVSSSVAAVDFINGTSDVVLDNTYESYLIICSQFLPGIGQAHRRRCHAHGCWQRLYV